VCVCVCVSDGREIEEVPYEMYCDAEIGVCVCVRLMARKCFFCNILKIVFSTIN